MTRAHALRFVVPWFTLGIGQLLLVGGCTWQRTLDDARSLAGSAGVIADWEVARSSSWRLPAGARVLIVADPVCAGNDCDAAAALGQPAALNQLLATHLLERLTGPWPGTRLHAEPLDVDAALALAAVRRADFLIHVQAREVRRDAAFARGRSRLRLQLLASATGVVVDTTRIDARVDLLGRSRDLDALLDRPLDDYVALLVGR